MQQANEPEPVALRPHAGQGPQGAALAAPFEVYFTDTRGGVELAYPDGWQITTRLNEVLGVGGWSFRVLREEFDADADEVWVKGRMKATVDGRDVTVEQFGGGKVKRGVALCTVCGRKANQYHDRDAPGHKATPAGRGEPLSLADDFKGAGTDALKKCASLLGVGLYFSRRDGTPLPGRPLAARKRNDSRPAPPQQQRPAPAQPTGQANYVCKEPVEGGVCGTVLEPHEFSNGTVWNARALAEKGHKEFGLVLCWSHLQARRKPA